MTDTDDTKTTSTFSATVDLQTYNNLLNVYRETLKELTVSREEQRLLSHSHNDAARWFRWAYTFCWIGFLQIGLAVGFSLGIMWGTL